MRSRNTRFPHRSLQRALRAAAVGSALMLTVPAFAAGQVSVQEYRIDAGQLQDALSRFAAEAGVQLLFDPLLLNGKTSNGLTARVSVEEGFRQLLQGSGLVAEQEKNGFRIRLQTEQSAPSSGVSAETYQLPSVVISGQKIDRTLKETVQGISLVSGDELAEKGALDLTAAFDEMSNVNLVRYGNRNEFAIRGIQSGGVAGKGSLSSVIIDGMPLVQPAIDFGVPLWDVEQVAVAKGPMSTSVGQSAAAGAIFVTSKKPEFSHSGAVRAGIGSDNLWLMSGMANTALTDNLALRLTAERSDNDGQITNTYLDDERHDFLNTSAYKASLLYQPDYRFSSQLTLGVQRSRYGEGLTCTEAQSTADYPCEAGDHKAIQDLKPRFDDSRRYALVDINAQLTGSWAIQSLSSWSKSEHDYQVDSDRNHPLSPNVATFAGVPVDSSYTDFVSQVDYLHLSEELKLTYDNNGIMSATGLYLAREKTTNDSDSGSALDLAALNPMAPADMFYIPFNQRVRNGLDQTTAVALFNETDIALSQALTLTLGLRYNREKREFRSGATVIREMDLTSGDALLGFPDGSLNALIDGQAQLLSLSSAATDNAVYTAWLPKAGLSWQVQDELMLGYTYSRGYRSGGTDLNIGTGAVYSYDPETLSNHELALRSAWLDERLMVNANLFYLSWTDQQVYVTGNTNGFDSQIANAGSSRSQGAELDVVFKADNGLNAALNAGYADTQFDDFVNGAEDYSDNRFPFSPDLNAALSFGFDAGAGFHAKWRTQYTGEAFSNPDNANKIKDYYLSHLTAGYRQASWQLDAYVNNLFDYEQVLYDYGWVKPIANTVTLVPGRTFGIMGQYRF